MIAESSYRKAFFIAIFFHVFLGFMLMAESSTKNPVLKKEVKNEPGDLTAIQDVGNPKPEIVKAVSVDNQEVMKAVNKLKEERANQAKAEQQRQQALVKQAELARKERQEEQKHLQRLKEEEAKLAIARKKQIEDEKKHLKELAIQKEKEAKELAALKTKQEQLAKKQKEETERLAELKKKQNEEKVKEAKEKAENDKIAQAKQKELADKQAAEEASRRAKLSGEVDKYKALIVNAISRRWILPENADSSLSSQFRIRLAPDGAVLEVSLTRSSGDAILDRSAQTAIYKASPLPVPNDPTTFELFRDISLTVRPENARG